MACACGMAFQIKTGSTIKVGIVANMNSDVEVNAQPKLSKNKNYDVLVSSETQCSVLAKLIEV